MNRLTIRYEDGTYGVSRDLPCGENSHDFKRLLIDKVGKYEDLIEVNLNHIKPKRLSDQAIALDNENNTYKKEEFIKMIEGLKLLKTGWNGENAYPFSDNAIELFKRIISNIVFLPDFIEATADCGLYIEFKSDNRELIYEISEERLEMILFKNNKLFKSTVFYNIEGNFDNTCIEIIKEELKNVITP